MYQISTRILGKPPGYTTKLLLIMKLSILLMTLAIMQASAAGLAQTVTLKQKGLKLEQIFKELRKQTGYNVLWTQKKISHTKAIDVDFNNTPLAMVMEQALKGQSLSYVIEEKTIIIKDLDRTALRKVETGKITGIVTDENGRPLIGASVKVIETKQGTMTDGKGAYTISVSPGKYTVEFSFISYATQHISNVQVSADQSQQLNIKLLPDAKDLKEVLVTALGIKREEKSLGYSAQKLDGSTVSDAPTSNWLNALEGKVAGLNIQKADGPMGSSDIILRGDKSLQLGNSGALIVIDGVPVNNQISGNSGSAYSSAEPSLDFGTAVTDLNPDDVASITILKGPGATALYGSRGANGAIIVTTKSGGARSGLGITVNSNTALDQVFNFPDYQYQYGQGAGSDVKYYSYGTSEDGGSTSGTSSGWGPKLNTGVKYFQYDPVTKTQSKEKLPWVAYPDNREGLFRTGLTTNNSVAIEGGNSATTARVSVNNTFNKYILENTGYQRTNVSFSLTQKISEKMQIATKINYYNKSSDNLPSTGYSNQTSSYFLMFTNANVDLNWFRDYWASEDDKQNRPFSSVPDNPYFALYEELNPMKRNGVFGNINFNYNFSKNLTFTAKTAIDMYDDISSNRQPMSAHHYTYGFYKEQNIIRYEQNSDFLLNYKKKLSKDFDMSAALGGNRMHSSYNRTRGSIRKLLIPGVYTLANGIDRPVLEGYKEEKAINSAYGFANFSFRDYLFFEVTARNDWSSVFSAANNSYFYPSANLSLVLSDLLKLRSNALSYTKLRLSYAEVGNDTRPYRIEKYYASSNFPSSVTNPTTLNNADLKPERTKSYEAGLEARFFKNKIGIDFSAYLTNTYDQILSVPVERASGYYNYVMNAGLVQNKGLELQAWGKILTRRDFSWRTTVNGAINRGKIVYLKDGIENIELYAMGSSGVSLMALPGGSIGDIYGRGYLRNGAGQIIYSNGVPQLTPDIVYQGSAVPKFKGGIGNEFKYKAFRLNILFDGEFGHKKYSLSNSVMTVSGKLMTTIPGREAGGILGTGVIRNEDGSYRANDVVVSPSVYYNAHFDRINAEANLFDATYIKLREARLDYTIKSKYLEKLGIRNTSAGVFGRNLFIWSAWPIFDPQSSTLNGGVMVQGIEVGQFPTTRTFGFNFKLSF